ncbi:MAG: hypothetical protein JXO22_15160 [Phycisphaerae bacterium]|nr:hypothetical protein [Phycisphaerae bacterium]
MSTALVLILIIGLLVLGPILQALAGSRKEPEQSPVNDELRTCQSCGFINSSKASYCGRCGGEL